jgi:hypothetical protein
LGVTKNNETKVIKEKRFTFTGNNTRIEIYEYEIDGCQYFGYLSGDSRSSFLTHKGNCSNKIHKN